MSKTLTERTFVWAHRGAPGATIGSNPALLYAPENTMPSFALAAEMQADGIETDVHFSKDGKIIVIHDNKLERTTNGQGLVTDYTFDELQVFDAGIKAGAQFKGTRIPTVDELLDFCREHNLVLNIEIKSNDPALPAALFDCVKKHNMVEGTLYSSFDHEQLARMLRVYPNAFVAPLYSFNMVHPWDYAVSMGAKAMHPNYNQLSLYPEYVEKCHAAGVRVHPWTVDSVEKAVELAAAGCDALITNRPDEIRKALGYC